MSKSEAIMVLVFAIIGVWQVTQWALAGVDRWHDYMIRRIEQRRRERT